MYSPEAKRAGAALGALALHGDLGRRRLGLPDVDALSSLDEVLVVILEGDGRVVLVEVELKQRRGKCSTRASSQIWKGIKLIQEKMI